MPGAGAGHRITYADQRAHSLIKKETRRVKCDNQESVAASM